MVSFRRFVLDSGWVFSGNVVGVVLGLIQSVVITRALGLELFGIYALVVVAVTVANQLTSFRMTDFVVKYVSEAQAQQQRARAAGAVKVSIVLEATASVVAFGLALLLAPPIARWFVRVPESAGLIVLYSFTILANAVAETSAGVLQVFDRFRLYSQVTALQRLLLLIGVVVAVMSGAQLAGILLASAAMTALGSVIQVLLAGRELARQLGREWWRTSLSVMRHRWWPALQFAFSTNIGAKLSIITKDADVLWLGLFRSPTEAGLYRVVTSLATAVLAPAAPLAQAIYPQIAHAAARHAWADFRRLLRSSTGLAAAYVLPVVALLVAGAPWVVTTLYGADFRPAAQALRLLAPGMAYGTVLFWSRPALLAIHRPDFAMWVNAGMAALKIAGILALVPLWGYLGNAGLVAALYFVGVTICVGKVESELRRAAGEALVPTAEGAPR